MVLALLVVMGVGAAATLGLRAFKENLLYFYSPSDIAAGKAPTTQSYRVGGLVGVGSLKRDEDSLKVSFDLTDGASSFAVQYTGILPDLFREGQGIVATGKMQNNHFVASEILAKHDENYMPPEVSDALKRAEGTTAMPHEFGGPPTATEAEEKTQ
jgi:cytochrome c-type biogenesis protein CcmE|tara:strand:- start:23233 stop:23700 length:468 start_codon:yes stop_codon:yes gene_type:complete